MEPTTSVGSPVTVLRNGERKRVKDIVVNVPRRLMTTKVQKGVPNLVFPESRGKIIGLMLNSPQIKISCACVNIPEPSSELDGLFAIN